MAPDAISATAEGFNEMRGRVPVLTRIEMHYVLRIPPGTPRDKVDRALETHVEKCPTAQSLKGAVEVTFDADVAEAD
jgi:uncharacterized OsmC-like protein